MNESDITETRINELGRASRRAALLSIVGFLALVAAGAYAYVELRSLQNERKSLIQETRTLATEATNSRKELAVLQSELAKSRAALSSARAAINAFHAGRLSDAVTLYDEALSSDPDNPYLQNLRAYSLFKLGRVSDAIEGERRSISADPSYAWGYFDLARFLYAASPPMITEAKRAEARAIELRPDMQTIMSNDGEFQRLRKTALKQQ